MLGTKDTNTKETQTQQLRNSVRQVIQWMTLIHRGASHEIGAMGRAWKSPWKSLPTGAGDLLGHGIQVVYEFTRAAVTTE